MTTILNNNSVLLFLIDKFNQGVAICDMKFNIILWNEEAVKIVGQSPNNIGKDNWVNHYKFYSREGKPLQEEDRAMYKAITEQKETKAKTIYRNEKGHEIFIDTRAYPLYDDEKNLIGSVAFFQDVSNKVKMDNLLTEVEQKLKEMQEYLQEYLNSLSV